MQVRQRQPEIHGVSCAMRDHSIDLTYFLPGFRIYILKGSDEHDDQALDDGSCGCRNRPPAIPGRSRNCTEQLATLKPQSLLSQSYDRIDPEGPAGCKPTIPTSSMTPKKVNGSHGVTPNKNPEM